MHSRQQKEEVPFEFDADSLAFDMGNEPVVSVRKSTKQTELTPEDVKDAHWFYDTPGITKENCVCIGFLSETFAFNFRGTLLTGRKHAKRCTSLLKLLSGFFMKVVQGGMCASNSVFTLLPTL